MFTKVRDEYRLEDVERGLLWEPIGRRDYGNIEIAVLTVRGQRIPHEYYLEPMSQAGAEWVQLNLLSVGGPSLRYLKGSQTSVLSRPSIEKRFCTTWQKQHSPGIQWVPDGSNVLDMRGSRQMIERFC